MMNAETKNALAAYFEEFYYFAQEADDFIALCREVFAENHGEQEARKIEWNEIERILE
jgi:DNA primase catalytic subunit